MMVQQTLVETRHLVSFLLSRVNDDELEIRKVAKKSRAAQTPMPADQISGVRSFDRLLKECAAKRLLIGLLQRTLVLGDGPSGVEARDDASQQLRIMAAVYADHLSYREEWQPS